jgi:SAM-dependent methyltransferase
MTSFRDLESQQDIIKWVAELNQDRPERSKIKQHIVVQLKLLPFNPLQGIELGFGPGHLAEQLLAEIPRLRYTGIDSSELLYGYARDRLTAFGSRATLVKADLNQNRWLELLPDPAHAIVSMQSLHDLGGEDQVNRIYALAQSLLAPGGLFLNADLVVPPQQQNPDNPGRLSIPRHLELLQAHGYSRVACTLEAGDFGCFVGFK